MRCVPNPNPNRNPVSELRAVILSLGLGLAKLSPEYCLLPGFVFCRASAATTNTAYM